MIPKEYFNIVEEQKQITLCIYAEQEYISNYIRRINNFYEVWMLRYIKEKYPNHGSIIDIGANIGNHVKYFANFLNFEGIYCFEPHDINFNLLVDNVQSKVIAYNCALGAVKGKCKLWSSAEPNSGHFRVYNDNSADASIDLLTLDEFVFSNVTLIKIDVEGFEYNVILGAMRTILKYKPVLFIETNDNNVTELLQMIGYVPHKYFFEGNYDKGPIPTIEFVYEGSKYA